MLEKTIISENELAAAARKINLEERIKLILRMPALDLDGNAFEGKYELNNIKSIIKFISNKLRLDNDGKNISYTNLDTNDKIILSQRSAQKIATHYRSGEAYQKTIAHIPKIIENMKLLDETKSEKTKAKFSNYSYYITQVNIDGEQHTILSTVGRTEQDVYYDQNVFKGSIQDVFNQAENSVENSKYGRLATLLQKAKKSGWSNAKIKSPANPATQDSWNPFGLETP